LWQSGAQIEATGVRHFCLPRHGIRARSGRKPKIGYFETVALTDKANGKTSGLN
jgi:hypothetical protein